ncbi:conserved hypothetical protein [Planctopirus limnophila DSM 3776]|uniref:G domain-containing protein n=1 Tax=Planctopirus limnophila (strain ATCC 43296 / DSM 3776 / IFAM 1008 / Mu 290) TaxID=521674 RepID=D5SPT3_PLAL2|nr:GTPase [Planctopirus limnophila]ADG68308.1 conserved hypothetical protein [Planctopirus limnophila DSM 3776]
MAPFWNFWKKDPVASIGGTAAGATKSDRPPVDFPTPVLWLLGKTGSGKTSIIRYLTESTTAEIGNGFRPQTKCTNRYDFPSVEKPLLTFLDTRGLGEAGYDHEPDVASLATQAHLILLVVRAMDHAQAEMVALLQQIRKQSSQIPILLVLTHLHEAYPGQDHPAEMLAAEKSNITPQMPPWPSALARSIEQQLMTFGQFIHGHATIDFTQPEDGFTNPFLGAQELTRDICSLLPDAAMVQLSQLQQFQRAQAGLPANLTTRLQRTLWIYSSAAAVAGAIPAPWFDLPVVVGLQAALAWQISNEYRYQYSGSRIAQLVSAVSGQMIARQGLRELLKIIPYVGSVTSSALAFATTYGLGQTIIWAIERERSGQFPSTQEFREHLKNQASLAGEIWRKRSPPENSSSDRMPG